MKVSIRDMSTPVATPVATARNLRLAKPIIDLDTAPYAITLLRISLGVLFLAHGLLKAFVFTLSGTAQFFQSVGLPGSMAYVVTHMEIFGGLLLIVGLYTRWVALALFPILLVATFKVHGASGWLFTNEGGGWEFPAFFAVTTLVQFLLGDGAYALSDRLKSQR